ncbi:MAG TPA: hypothetical protein VIV09_07630 [Pseudolabrys sp.]
MAITNTLIRFLPGWVLLNGRKNTDENQLEGASSSCERWGIWCGALVIVAVAAEAYIAIRHPEYDSVLFRWGSAATDVLIAVDIVGEVALGMWDGRIQTELRERSNARLASAIQVAADAQKEAAATRLEAEKLKEKVAWRTISQEQSNAMQTVLSQNPGAVNLRWIEGDPEGLYFALELSTVLQNAKWRVGAGSIGLLDGPCVGLILPPNAGADRHTLFAALAAAKLGVSSVPAREAGMEVASTIHGAPTLVVGSRFPVRL